MTCNLRIFTSTTASSRISILATTWTTTFWKTSSGIPPSIIAMRTFSTFIIIPSTNSCFFQKTFIIICFPISPTNWSERPITSYKKKKPRNISILSFFLINIYFIFSHYLSWDSISHPPRCTTDISELLFLPDVIVMDQSPSPGKIRTQSLGFLEGPRPDFWGRTQASAQAHIIRAGLGQSPTRN